MKNLLLPNVITLATRTISAAATAAFLLVTSHDALRAASPVADLSQGAPLEIEDTELSDQGEFELQLPLRYERTRANGNDFDVEPELQIGLTDRLQLEISVPIKAGSGDRSGSGNLAVDFLGKLWEEKRAIPSVALGIGAEFPTGYESDGVETEVRLLTTKSFGPEQSQQRVHLNVSWQHQFEAGPGEREDRFKAVVGYDHTVGKDLLLMADVFVEQQPEQGETYKMVEIGLRHTVGDKAVAGVGIGTGLDHDSPKLRITASLEISF